MACYKTWNWHNIYKNVYHILWHITKHGIGTTCHGLIITAELWIFTVFLKKKKKKKRLLRTTAPQQWLIKY